MTFLPKSAANYCSVLSTGHLETEFLIFLSPQENTELLSKFQVATASFSCSLLYLNLLKLNTSTKKVTKFSFRVMQFSLKSQHKNSATLV
jgi:hypothetical protein